MRALTSSPVRPQIQSCVSASYGLPGSVCHGRILTLQKNSESEPVRDQQQGHDESRNEIGRAKLARRDPGVIGLVESIEEIGCTPDIEDPCDDNAGCSGQRYQGKQGEYCRNDIPICRRLREGRGQVWRHYPWHEKCQPNETEAVQDEQRPQSFGRLPETEFRPDVSSGNDSPRDTAKCDADEKKSCDCINSSY